MRRDALDKGKVRRLLVKSNPIRYSDVKRLICLLSGLAAGPDDDVNCEIAENRTQQIRLLILSPS